MTRSLRDYITETETWIDSPAVGDDFAINIREECLVESHIVAVVEDGVVLAADEGMIEILESYGMLDEGVGQAVRRGLKSLRRGAQGWGSEEDKPRELVRRNRAHPDQTVLDLRKGADPVPGSPRALQVRVLDREIKKRWGMDETSDPYRREISPPSPEEFEEGVAEGLPGLGIWQEVMNAFSKGWPDADPIDLLQPIVKKHGISFEDLDLLAQDQGYKDIYDAYDDFDTLDQQGVAEGAVEKTPADYEAIARKHTADIQKSTENGKAYARKMVGRAQRAAEILNKGGSQEEALRHYQGTDTEGVAEGSMSRKDKDQAVRKWFSHDPETGENILGMGKKEREENKAFASAKREIERQKKKERAIAEDQDLRRIQELAGMPPAAMPAVTEGGVKNWISDLYGKFNETYEVPVDISDDDYLEAVEEFLRDQGVDPDRIEDVGELFLDMRDQEEDDDHDYANQLDAEQYDDENMMDEAKYQGREVSLGKPFLTPDGPKKRSVYVKNPKGNVVKVNFGDKKLRIKKSNPKRRKSFRARHHCANPGPRHKARYWSCRFW